MPLYPEPQNMTGIFDIFEYANVVSDQIFGVGIPISLYLIILGYLNLKGESVADSAAVAGFITSIACIFLLLLGFVQTKHFFIVVILYSLSLLWSYWNKV